jgi:hypothetical protein
MKMKLATSDQKKTDKTRRGSAGVVRSMMLLNSFEDMHAPYTQVYMRFDIILVLRIVSL